MQSAIPAKGQRMKPYWKSVFRWDKEMRLLRIGRIIYQGGPKGSRPGVEGGGYSAKLSIGLTPKLFGFHRGWHEWSFTLFGVRIHHLKSFGGWLC